MRVRLLPAIAFLLVPAIVVAQQPTPSQQLTGCMDRIIAVVQPPPGEAARTFSTTLRVIESENLPKELAGASADVMIQAPDRLRVTVRVRNDSYEFGRIGQSLWVYVPATRFGVVGLPEIPRFSADPSSVEPDSLAPLALPINPAILRLSVSALQARQLTDEEIEGAPCMVLGIDPPAALVQLLNMAESSVQVAIRKSDSMPMELRYSAGKSRLVARFEKLSFSEPVADDRWQLHAAPGDHVEKVATSHLQRFFPVAMDTLTAKVPSLPPATGQRRLVATEGKGRLEICDSTRVLFLAGTPEEMGHQQGVLLRSEVRDLTSRILYGVGVGSSFAKGRWFFGEIESAHKRLAPFISDRTYREMDALADSAGLSRQEMRLANFFPELFHCTGFAVTGSATVGGRIYHGRVLDYLRGMGLEQNAVVMVYRPDVGNAWVNIGYAGFVGSVTAMNEKRISIGEMGGRGEGNWDGKPMAQLMREVMEKASTLEQAVEIMRSSPRTCEYYYVIADGNTKKAVGIKATPTIFETVGLGEPHPQLAHPVTDTVLLSAGSRYEELVHRVQAGFGKFDAASARALMDPPVCMNSNIQSVLFAPDTLDFWVANADSRNVASLARYTHYNLAELLSPSSPGKPSAN